MLERASPLPRSLEPGQPRPRELAHVIADHTKGGVELFGDLARAGGSLLEDAEDRDSERMRKRLGDLRI
jgi:hypothetical protein